jgi:hypothetical protein
VAIIEISVAGMEQAERAIARLIRRLPEVAQRAMREEAEIEMTEAKKRTPVDTGVLRDSGKVEQYGEFGVRWSFGGAAMAYAVYVHENLDVYHPVGQAKFLESVLMESTPYLPARIGRRMQRLLGTG